MAEKQIDEIREDPQEPVYEGLEEALRPGAGPFPDLPIFPWVLRASGLYVYAQRIIVPTPFPRPVPRPIPLSPNVPVPRPLPLSPPLPDPVPLGRADVGGEGDLSLPFSLFREELRLDVDGDYPQMTASGVLQNRFRKRVHWIARLKAAGTNAWSGAIWYKDGDTSLLPHTQVHIKVVRSIAFSSRKATVTFKGGGAADRSRTLRFSSAYFHPVEFEYDCESGATAVLSIDTGAHPNRPPAMPTGTLTIETVFRRTGFDAKRSTASSVIPNDGPDPNATWSDAEMHDAMQVYWSHFANASQWALWVLFAKRHDIGPSLGGIMFDDIGPNHRQGTAVFSDSFIADAPAGDPSPAAWVDRMMFWTSVHEMGHAFNLAHSWQKHLGTPWIPLASEPEARSFMNYPYSVSGGQAAFFANFEFRFSDNELLFMRHAPQRFVQMGNADWFDDHGFEGAAISPERVFDLELHVNRPRPVFDFLEPVVLDLKLTNLSQEPKLVPQGFLQEFEHMTVVLKRDGRPARQWLPFARYCSKTSKIVLAPGESLTDSLFISSGRNGWDLAEPGLYTVQIAAELEDSDIVSAPLRLRITPPRSRDEELIAQDVFTDDAGRVMALDGSRVLEAGNDAWREVIEKLPESKAAIHAQVCLALPQTRNYRVLNVEAPPTAPGIDGEGAKASFVVEAQKPDEAADRLDKALMVERDTAAMTLGHEDYRYYAAAYSDWLEKQGDGKAAKRVADSAKKAVATA